MELASTNIYRLMMKWPVDHLVFIYMYLYSSTERSAHFGQVHLHFIYYLNEINKRFDTNGS